MSGVAWGTRALEELVRQSDEVSPDGLTADNGLRPLEDFLDHLRRVWEGLVLLLSCFKLAKLRREVLAHSNLNRVHKLSDKLASLDDRDAGLRRRLPLLRCVNRLDGRKLARLKVALNRRAREAKVSGDLRRRHFLVLRENVNKAERRVVDSRRAAVLERIPIAHLREGANVTRPDFVCEAARPERAAGARRTRR